MELKRECEVDSSFFVLEGNGPSSSGWKQIPYKRLVESTRAWWRGSVMGVLEGVLGD